MKIILVYFVIFTFFSCVENEHIKDKFDVEKNLIQRFYYKTKADSIPYLIVEYYKDGIIKDSSYYNDRGKKNGYSYFCDIVKNYTRECNFKNGIKEGTLKAKFTNGYYVIAHYANGNWNGINYEFSNDNKILYKKLYLNNKLFYSERSYYLSKGDTIESKIITKDKISLINRIIDSDNVITKEYYGHLYSDTTFIGSLVYRNNELRDDYNENNYHEIFAKDTILNGETLDVKVVGHFGNFEKRNTYIKVVIGSLKSTSNLIFDDNTQEFGSKIGNHQVSFTIDDYHKGYNLILGKVLLMRDSTIINESIIFEDYTVL